MLLMVVSRSRVKLHASRLTLHSPLHLSLSPVQLLVNLQFVGLPLLQRLYKLSTIMMAEDQSMFAYLQHLVVVHDWDLL